ncbi:TraB/GumN family protein [Methanomicrobium mobile]|uniref:TraB/GumN family protein n=1 Tax=Methanomicrobium mobile TaxID=2205 RepID=UPI0005B254FC|nr:TraB/GumN family protein [Methanomicrobium mobile]
MSEIRLVGTAHVSQNSIDEVKRAIEEFEPDVVAVELDRGRFAAIKKEGKPPEMDDIIKGGNFNETLVQWMLAYIQRKIGMDVGIEPGAEMLAAINEAESRQIPVALADRDIRITLSRFWRGMTVLEKLRLIYALMGTIISGKGDDEEDKIDIEALTKDKDLIEMAIDEFHKFSPNGAYALIDERDAYLAHSLLRLSQRHEKVLGIVGAGHMKGIQRYFEKPETLPPFESLTAQQKTHNWKLIIGGVIIAMFAFILLLIGFSGVGVDVLLGAVVYWVIINGVLAAGFTLIAGGHPLSALTAFCVSWLTSLNPFLAAGWFAAVTEAKVRKPKASDLQKIIDAESFSDMRQVPMFKVIFVAALANVGSMLGTFAYFIFIFPILGIDPTVVFVDGFNNLVAWISGLFR